MITKAPIGLEQVERSVIACFLIDSAIKSEEINLKEEYFFSSKYKTIFQAIQRLEKEGTAVDILTISTELEKMDKLEYVGGNMEIIEITNTIFTSAHIRDYVKKLKAEYIRVQFMQISQKISAMADTNAITSDSIFQLSSELLELSTQDEADRMDDLIYELEDYIYEGKDKKLRGYSWGKGLSFLDKVTNGIIKQRQYRIGAPSNVGKSQLMYGVINSLLSQGVKIAFFTLENSFAMTGINILANKQEVNSRKIDDSSVPADIDYLDKHRDKLFVIEEKYDISDIFAKVLELKPDVVILDYIGLMEVRGFSEEKKYTEYANRVKKFTKKTKVAWMDISNLSGKAQDDEFMMDRGEFYGSTALKNVVDIGIHMKHYKQFYKFKESYDPDSEEGKNLENKQAIEMVVSKNRFGVAKVKKIFIMDFDKGSKFTEATKKEITTWDGF